MGLDAEMAVARRLSGLAEVALAVAQAETVAEVSRVLVDRGFGVLGASGGAVAFRDDKRGVLELSVAGYDSAELIRRYAEIPINGPLPMSEVARTDEPVFLRDRETVLDRYPDMAGMQRHVDAQAWAFLPLRVRDRRLGVLIASWPDAQGFGPAEEQLLMAFAAQCSQALDRIQTRDAQTLALYERGQAQDKLALLFDVTRALSSTLDTAEAVGRLARMVAPRLGDWCIVTIVDDDGRMRDVGCWHADPDRRTVVERYADIRLAALTGESFVGRALRSGLPVVVTTDAEARIREFLRPGECRDLLAELAPDAAAVFPLQARGRTTGLLTLYRDVARGPFDADDLATVGEVAARAGMALDNARLFAQQRRLAEALQRSLLTDPPQPAHLEIAVRYVPAAEEAQVGGDWYDAFVQPSGATVVTVGDVVGHDTAAAAAMGQIRALLRGIAYTTEEGPAEVLSRLDAAITGLRVATTASAVVARLEQTPEEERRGVTRLRWSNAGHPPPMVVSPTGEVTVLDSVHPDLLLGVDPATSRLESVVDVHAGSTVLLYTDGLVERRGQSLDEASSSWRRCWASCGSVPRSRWPTRSWPTCCRRKRRTTWPSSSYACIGRRDTTTRGGLKGDA
jgi:GAF domain-containing protein